ncbi:hypothetical protein E4Z66_06830 [Aliishimia ponticola]|uniref:Uncharacterized protein n=1 Tax=Aliishimia ponticola TaxID=2499833 RepID=A0A4S4NBF6_9RHOB|nr:hypothetical protein [Aliishimia ponticola]THH36659.1 hypothetical protein E4Z66_06830 [Aliishimia ponticola]
MNIALAQSEIAHFLDCGSRAITDLWAARRLQRSVFVDHRTTPELSHSSVYDVLDYYIQTEVIAPGEPASEVEAWLCAVDELVESDTWQTQSFEDTAFELMQMYMDFSGTPCPPMELAVRGTKVLTAYFCLLRFVENDNQSDAQQDLPLSLEY